MSSATSLQMRETYKQSITQKGHTTF